jgi:NADH-quinone oxidoreductase subunit E
MAVELSQESRDKIEQLLQRYPTRRAVMLPALHIVTQEFPLLDDDVCQVVADLLQLPLVEVKGVATFYTMFPTERRGKHLLQVCINLPCSLNGGRRILRYLESKLGIDAGDMTPDGRCTLLGVECLAACDRAPMMYVDEELYGELDETKLDQLLDELSS